MALAGQVVEVFPILRSVLEYAGYCLLLRETPELESVFIRRHFSTKGKQKQKEVFTIGAAKVAVRRRDTKLADVFVENYERSIDFGHTQIRTRCSVRWSLLAKRTVRQV
jgi:hypothetical protein